MLTNELSYKNQVSWLHRENSAQKRTYTTLPFKKRFGYFSPELVQPVFSHRYWAISQASRDFGI